MAQFNFKQTSQAALLMSIAAAFPVVGHGAPAARVDFASGNVTAVSTSGQSRPLAKGAQLEQGETIATNTGRAQLRFTDGAYVSLQPQTEFRIDQYRFAGTQDGNEKGVFSLIKGGLRTITGLVGRSNRKNYQINTSVATIGIRGTEYTIQYGQSMTGTVGEGEIEVCNGAGCLNVTNGESYYVLNQDVKPELTNKGTDLPPAPPESPPQKFAENENVDPSGDLCTLSPAQCQPPPKATGILTGTISASAATIQSALFGKTSINTTATLDSSGVLTGFDEIGSSGGVFPVTIQGPVSLLDRGNDGIIAWGRALGGGGGEFGIQLNDTLHYIAGVPADLTALGGVVASYSLLGGTSPTKFSTGAIVGTLDTASMTANFGSGTVSGQLDWTISGTSATGTFSGSITSAQISSSGSVSGSLFGSGANLSVNGFFAGASAERAGIVYDVFDAFGSNSFIGAAALKR